MTPTSGSALRAAWIWLAAVGCALLLGAPLALADDEPAVQDVQAAQSELDERAAQLGELTQQLMDSQAAVAELDERIGSLALEIGERQAARAELQGRISSLAKVMYKDGDDIDVISIIADSESMDEVMRRFEMRGKVLEEYVQLSDEQKRAAQELEVAYHEISSQKDAQYDQIQDLKARKAQLDVTVSSLQVHLDELNEAGRAAVVEATTASHEATNTVEDALHVQPAAPAAPATAEQPAEDEQRGAVPGAEAADEPEATAQDQTAAEPAASSGSGQVAAGWQTGLASAYGGSSDPSTPNPGTTATGAVCDDYSMGVAVPMAWGPTAYYGRSVEISYGGRTVVATVNDCGGMGGGSRALDLQPGVFKALGASTCNDWGVREVQYRFL